MSASIWLLTPSTFPPLSTVKFFQILRYFKGVLSLHYLLTPSTSPVTYPTKPEEDTEKNLYYHIEGQPVFRLEVPLTTNTIKAIVTILFATSL